MVKRYHDEPGSTVIQTLTDILFNDEPHRLFTGWLTLAETLSTLNRKKNAKAIPQQHYQAIRHCFLIEIRKTNILSVDDALIKSSLDLIEHHNLNSSDALFLRQALHWKAQLPPGDQVVMVAADHRLLRASAAKGLLVLDPEATPVDKVTDFVTSPLAKDG